MQSLFLLIITLVTQAIFGTASEIPVSQEDSLQENGVYMSIDDNPQDLSDDTVITSPTPHPSVEPSQTPTPVPVITCKFSEESGCGYFEQSITKEECSELRCCKKYDEDKYVVASLDKCQQFYVEEVDRNTEKNKKAKEEYEQQMQEYLAQVEDYELYKQQVEEYNRKVDEYNKLIQQQEESVKNTSTNKPMGFYGTIGVDFPVVR